MVYAKPRGRDAKAAQLTFTSIKRPPCSRSRDGEQKCV